MDAVVEFLELRDPAAAFGSERTVFALTLTASVNVLRVAFTIGFGAFKKQEGMVSAGFPAFVTVFFFVVNKAFTPWFIR